MKDESINFELFWWFIDSSTVVACHITEKKVIILKSLKLIKASINEESLQLFPTDEIIGPSELRFNNNWLF